MQELQLQNLQKMMTDLNDDSTPSREKDQSSKAHGELYESSSQVKREQHEFPQKAGQNAQNATCFPINDPSQIRDAIKRNVQGQMS